MATKTHPCPVCRAPGVVMWWACCKGCHKALPRRLGQRLALAYRHRIEDPAAWHDAVITALLWQKHSRVPTTPNGGSNG